MIADRIGRNDMRILPGDKIRFVIPFQNKGKHIAIFMDDIGNLEAVHFDAGISPPMQNTKIDRTQKHLEPFRHEPNPEKPGQENPPRLVVIVNTQNLASSWMPKIRPSPIVARVPVELLFVI